MCMPVSLIKISYDTTFGFVVQKDNYLTEQIHKDYGGIIIVEVNTRGLSIFCWFVGT